MFYAVFLTKLPESLCSRVDEYLGNRTKALLNEARWFSALIDCLYLIFWNTSMRIHLFVLLPSYEFRTLLFALYDLRLEFFDVPGRFSGNTEKFLGKHDCLFTRATEQIVSAVNFLRQLSYQGLTTTAGLGEPEFIRETVNLLLLGNRRHILEQFIPQAESLVVLRNGYMSVRIKLRILMLKNS